MARSSKSGAAGAGGKGGAGLKRVRGGAADSKPGGGKPGAGKLPGGKPAGGKPGRLTGKARVLSSKVSFEGKIFSVTTDEVEEPGGVTATRDVIRHSGSVIVLAVDSSKSKRNPTILIERQFRYAAGQFLLELPAGRIDEGEKPLAAARRELIEETGFRARRWTPLTRYFASPGFLGEEMLVYLAEDLVAGEAQPEADERIELMQVPLDDLLEQIDAGRIHDGKTILAVLLYAARRRRDAGGRRGM